VDYHALQNTRLNKVASWFLQFLSAAVTSARKTNEPINSLLPSTIFGASFMMRGYLKDETLKDLLETHLNQKLGMLAFGLGYNGEGEVTANGGSEVLFEVKEQGEKALMCVPAMYGAVGYNMGGLLFNDRTGLTRPEAVSQAQADVDPACARLAALQFVKHWHRIDSRQPYSLKTMASDKGLEAREAHDKLETEHRTMQSGGDSPNGKVVDVSSDCFRPDTHGKALPKAVNCWFYAECHWQLINTMCATPSPNG